jgi:hypothetical protein
MSTPKDKRAAPRRGAVGQAPIMLMPAPAPLVCPFGTMAAAWTAQVAGAEVMAAALAGMKGWHHAWVAAALAPAAMAACLVVAPVLLAEAALQRAHQATAGEMLAREPALPARD